MHFTDLFIRRPVLATVVSLLIVLLGLNALNNLQIRQYPELEDAVIRVSTAYPGANAELIQGFITTPLQQSVAGAEGIDYIKSSSQQNSSSIEAHIKLGYDANAALTEIMAKVAEVKNQLPSEANDPVISKESGKGTALLYMSFYSEIMGNEQITDYLTRAVQPKLATLEGVAEAEILGKKTFAMRIWLDPVRMAAFGVTTTEVNQALLANNYQSAAGQVKGTYTVTSVNARTDLHDAEAFANLVVQSRGDTLIRLRDVASVELAAETYDSYVTFNGIPSVYIGINATPSANPLEVIEKVRAVMPEIKRQLPGPLQADIVYDATEYIEASIDEVITTLGEATLIVVIVVFLFLGSLRSVIVPVIAIPLSLVGVLFLMLQLGYSINLLTLLAMVLAIGLVVDDAIVVVENIHRHIEEGKSPLAAALEGAREIAIPVVSMTLTLAAVYAPIGFMGGLTGALFSEFAFTLAGAVLISGIVALTLSPMMCSKLLRHTEPGGLADWLDRQFDRLHLRYRALLDASLNYRPVTLLFTAAILLAIPGLFLLTQQELEPKEDQSIIFISASSPQYANLDYMNRNTEALNDIYREFPEFLRGFQINGAGTVQSAFGGMQLKPWDQRERSQLELTPIVQQRINSIPGLQIFAFDMPSLPGAGGGLPVEFILSTTLDYQTLFQVTEDLAQAARQSGMFAMVKNELQFNNPEVVLEIDRNKAAQLGVSMSDIGQTLATMLGENDLNRFSINGRSYKVIPQTDRKYRASKEWLKRYYVRSSTGELVPLAAVTRISRETRPNSLTQFQQLNSAKLVAVPMVPLGTALDFLNAKAREIAPKGFSIDYEGQSRQLIEEGSALVFTFLISLIVIYLVLAAQFESFRDPWIILISVPLSIFGALVPLTLGVGGANLNIYTQVGLVTLIGLISKHGILIVEFANQLQAERGLGICEAVLESASIRLRPVLMTTAATVLGVVPLVLASGAGAVSRYNIGLVISTGMTVGTLFTLFVVPMLYSLLARRHQTEVVQPV